MKDMLALVASRRWGIIISLMAVASVIGAMLVLSGCSSDWLVSDSSESLDDGSSFFDQPYDADAVAKRRDVTDVEYSSAQQFMRTSEGGVLPLDDDPAVAAFVVLRDSFVRDTLISVQVTRLTTADGETPVVYSFQPDGLQFSRPAIVRINAHEVFGKSTRTVSFYGLNEITHEWELLQTRNVDSLNSVVCFDVEHFSDYGAHNGEDNGATDSEK
ncbi:MAG: hypothetical protein JSU65_06025 [Candidatus Zixiibacteriota bacterium]|nr:MAG: hypothetical protein JSU65_06025 [candidate division Zixibacteria bacterium]